MSSRVTNRDLYDAINNLRRETSHRIDRLEDEVSKNTAWRNQVMGKFAVILILAQLIVTLIVSTVKDVIAKGL